MDSVCEMFLIKLLEKEYKVLVALSITMKFGLYNH